MTVYSRRSRLLRCAILALAPAVVCLEASAFNANDVSSKQEALVVSLDHVVPEYKAGTKFRSPPTIDTALAEDLGKRLQRPLSTVGSEKRKAGALAAASKANIQLTTLDGTVAIPQSLAVIPVNYRAAPMAIMRTDTTIKRWEQLKGRSVCVANGGNHTGTLANQYGAIEKIYPSATDALIALRVGECDAAVHDHTMLEELIRLPEWKKFSARLPAGKASTLAFLVPAEDKKTVGMLKRVAADWNAKAYPDALVKKAVRHIAFEVYLEQDVPDCH